MIILLKMRMNYKIGKFLIDMIKYLINKRYDFKILIYGENKKWNLVMFQYY